MLRSLVGSEMCIRDRPKCTRPTRTRYILINKATDIDQPLKCSVPLTSTPNEAREDTRKKRKLNNKKYKNKSISSSDNFYYIKMMMKTRVDYQHNLKQKFTNAPLNSINKFLTNKLNKLPAQSYSYI